MTDPDAVFHSEYEPHKRKYDEDDSEDIDIDNIPLLEDEEED